MNRWDGMVVVWRWWSHGRNWGGIPGFQGMVGSIG